VLTAFTVPNCRERTGVGAAYRGSRRGRMNTAAMARAAMAIMTHSGGRLRGVLGRDGGFAILLVDAPRAARPGRLL